MKTKTEKIQNKKKKILKRLIIFVVIVAIIITIGHFIFQYFSNVVCENLTSIAASEQYVKKGNEKVEMPSFYTDIDTLLNESVLLSTYAYDTQNSDADYVGEFNKLGYENVSHYENKVSQLYKNLSKKDKNAAVMMAPVNATVASKTLDNNQVMIAIAFKGTDSSNINDDLSDMYKAVDKNGFHKGFMFNATQFDKKADDITFKIDSKDVTLKSILNDIKSPNSKYKLLITGHSLGAAVADVYAGYILKNKGVDSSNVAAITYGAPKSCSLSYEYTENNILNIINTDDLVPTIGAEEHIGTCLYFTPSESFRKTNYKEKYIEPNIYNSYSDLISSVKSGLIAHSVRDTYTPITKEIISNHNKYFK